MNKFITILLLLIISNSALAFDLKPACANKKITIYTKPNCSYCIGIRSILDKLKIKYTNIDLTKNRTIGNWLISTTNARTVPYVFLDEKYIGGYTDFVNICLKVKK